MTDKDKARIYKKIDALRERARAVHTLEKEHATVLDTYWEHVAAYGALVEDVRADIKTSTQNDPNDVRQSFGPFDLRTREITVVDIAALRKAAPQVLLAEDVVKEVSHEALHLLVMAKQLSPDIYRQVVEKVFDTPALYGPKAQKRPEIK